MAVKDAKIFRKPGIRRINDYRRRGGERARRVNPCKRVVYTAQMVFLLIVSSSKTAGSRLRQDGTWRWPLTTNRRADFRRKRNDRRPFNIIIVINSARPYLITAQRVRCYYTGIR